MDMEVTSESWSMSSLRTLSQSSPDGDGMCARKSGIVQSRELIDESNQISLISYKNWGEIHDSCPVEIRVDNKKSENHPNGKYIVAKNNFRPGDLIFSEYPLISGPCSSRNAEDQPVCLSCFRVVGTGYKCEKCKFPVCNYTCAQDQKHSTFECPILESCGVSPDEVLDPDIITVLRCLILREKHPQLWSRLVKLDAHHKLLEESGNAMTLLCAALTFIHEMCNLDQFDYDTIEQVSRIIDVNHLGSEDRPGAPLYRYGAYLYEHGSLLAHSCTPNAYRVININSRLEIYASVAIQADQPIRTVCTETFLGTWERREFLQDFHYFSCSCIRCASPTEYGTFFQAVKCQNNDHCQRNVEAVYLPLNPLDFQSQWVCNYCHDLKSYEFVSTLVQSFRMELAQIDGEMTMDRILKLEAVAAQHRGVTVHRNHFLIIRTEYDIVQRISSTLYRNRLIRTQVEFVERFVELTRKILSVFDVILPGFNRHRGRVLYFLQQGLLYLLQWNRNPNLKKKRKDSDNISLHRMNQEFLQVRQEGRSILVVEPEGSEERSLADEMAKSGEIMFPI